MIVEKGYISRQSAKKPRVVTQNSFIIMQNRAGNGHIYIGNLEFPKELIGLKTRLKLKLEVIDDLDVKTIIDDK